MPKVSIIIASYNSADYVGDAIDSVLSQTYSDYEIIVVDDGSTDETVLRLTPYRDRITYVYHDNRGVSATRNAGVSASTGQYLAYLDADDTFLPNKLASQVDLLDRQPDLGLVAGGWRYVDKQRRILEEVYPWSDYGEITFPKLLRRGLAPIHAVLMRRSWFEGICGFDTRFGQCADRDFWYRLSLAGCPMAWTPAIVCEYRIHGANMSLKVKQHYDELVSVIDSLFTKQGIPDRYLNQPSPLYAEIRLAETGRLYAIGDVSGAQDCLREAVRLDPRLVAHGDTRLVEHIGWWRQNVWTMDKDGFLDVVLNNLPAEVHLTDRQQRSLQVTCAKHDFYRAHKTQNAPEVWRCWTRIASREPRWLLDRGGWSILMQSLGLKKHGYRTSLA